MFGIVKNSICAGCYYCVETGGSIPEWPLVFHCTQRNEHGLRQHIKLMSINNKPIPHRNCRKKENPL